MCIICHFRIPSSRGAAAGCGDCDHLLPSMIVLTLLRTVVRCGGVLRDVPPTCPDSSPELIPAAVGLCSTFCLDEDTEASVTASKEPVLPHLPVLSCNALFQTGLVPQGPQLPRQQAGTLLHFSTPARSSLPRHRDGGFTPIHSDVPCA